MLTSGHLPFDDRIYYHMARSLSESHNIVEIVSSKVNITDSSRGIRFNCFSGDDLSKRHKINCFKERLADFEPVVIICSEPLTVLAAKKYKKRIPGHVKIIYDITEWYPSGKNLGDQKIPIRWLSFMKLLVFNIWVSGSADAFIFGEWYKSRPYRWLFPGKPHAFVSSYPHLKYIDHCDPELRDGKLRLCYSGKISMEKGYGNFFKAINRLSELRNDINIELKIIGWYETEKDREQCEKLFSDLNSNIAMLRYERQEFDAFLELIRKTDIFVDLRSASFESQNSLPVKLFYYAAFGRPVIFTDLKSIRKELEMARFGFPVDPLNTDQVVLSLLTYINDPGLYYEHCKNALNIAETKFNWQIIESRFLEFVTST